MPVIESVRAYCEAKEFHEPNFFGHCLCRCRVPAGNDYPSEGIPTPQTQSQSRKRIPFCPGQQRTDDSSGENSQVYLRAYRNAHHSGMIIMSLPGPVSIGHWKAHSRLSIWPFPLPGFVPTPKLTSHPMPLPLLECFGIAPRSILLDKGDFIGTRAMLGDHIVSQGLDVTYGDQPGSDAQIPYMPEQRSPDGKRADNPYQPAPVFSCPLHAHTQYLFSFD